MVRAWNHYVRKEEYKALEVKYILGVVKRNPLFLHEIEWKNNGFLFTISNMILIQIKADTYTSKVCNRNLLRVTSTIAF